MTTQDQRDQQQQAEPHYHGTHLHDHPGGNSIHEHSAQVNRWYKKPLIIFGSVVAGFLALYLILAFSVRSATTGPTFSCAISSAYGNWEPDITVTGPTPANGITGISIVYYDAQGNEVGSTPNVPFTVDVPSGQKGTFTIGDPKWWLAGITQTPASCQVTGYM